MIKDKTAVGWAKRVVCMNCSVSTEVQGASYPKLCSLCADKFAAEEYAAIISKAEGLHITISVQHVFIFLLPPLKPARPIAEQGSLQSGWDLTLYLSDVVLVLLKLTGEGSGPITVLVPRAGEHLHPEVCIRETGKGQDLPKMPADLTSWQEVQRGDWSKRPQSDVSGAMRTCVHRAGIVPIHQHPLRSPAQEQQLLERVRVCRCEGDTGLPEIAMRCAFRACSLQVYSFALLACESMRPSRYTTSGNKQ